MMERIPESIGLQRLCSEVWKKSINCRTNKADVGEMDGRVKSEA